MTETLTNRDIQHYRREGYIVPDTRLPASTMTRLHTALDETLEANPGTVDQAGLEAFAQAGVTRLSIGVQSLQAPIATRLGRGHNRSCPGLKQS